MQSKHGATSMDVINIIKPVRVFCGDIHSFYVKEYKHWWNFWWHIEMDGYVPAQYDLIDGEFIRKI